ncbi:MAG TPA: HD-GYP domain-containing protein [Halanaerobiales bacterium]|nr:HD-GYP domain-containing protein [Halanaerobiales bacterium]
MDDNFQSQNKINIEIDELKAGMKLANDIEYDFGGILLPAGTILDKKKIKRLKKLSSDYVYVYNENKEKIQKNLDRTQNAEMKYQEEIDEMKGIFKKARNLEQIEYDDVKDITKDIIGIGDESEMIDLLTKVREVDQYTYCHLLNVGVLAYMFGNWLKFDKERTFRLTEAGLMHDLGKAKIADEILNKPSELTSEEYEKMKKHSIYGYEMAQNAKHVAAETAQGILTHHERYNGNGYPLKLKGKDIPLFGRIIAIVDTFDALTANRIYQPESTPFEAIKLFREETFGDFDYDLLNIFLDKMPNYFVNEKVILNNGKEAEIVFINPRHQDKPIIRVDDSYIDLYKNDDIKIERMVDSYYTTEE